MPPEKKKKKILIFDETGFARVCNALLEGMGQCADIHPLSSEDGTGVLAEDYDLLITSYPYGGQLLHSLRNRDVAIIVLSASINHDLLSALNGFKNCFCMIKPLDFQKFRSLVNVAIDGQTDNYGGFKIV